MPVVQGSKQEDLVIVVDKPVRRFFRRLLVIIVFISCGAGGYYYGSFHSGMSEKKAVEERDRWKKLAQDHEEEMVKYRQKTAVLEKADQVDRYAEEDIREDIKELRERNAQLQEEIAFYKRVLDPTGNNNGLQIEKLELEATLDPHRYRYNLVMTQMGDNKNVLKGFAEVSVLGVQGDSSLTIPLKDLSEGMTGNKIKLGYRYFQNIKGEMTLPAGFIPQQVRVVARTEGAKKPQYIDKKLDWKIEESTANAIMEQ